LAPVRRLQEASHEESRTSHNHPTSSDTLPRASAHPAKLGAVTFDDENHAGKLGIACTTWGPCNVRRL